jgi:hypothetical protein
MIQIEKKPGLFDFGGIGLYGHSPDRATALTDRVAEFVAQHDLARFVGAQMPLRYLEPEREGEYDFSEIRRVLDWCAAHNKGFVLQIQTTNSTGKPEDRTIPAWMERRLGYDVCITRKTTANVATGKELINLGVDAVRARYIKLGQALAAEFDARPHFIGVTFGEPYIGNQAKIGKPITSEQRRDALLDLLGSFHDAFLLSLVGQFATWLYELRPEHMWDVMQYHVDRGGAYGAPDVAPCQGGRPNPDRRKTCRERVRDYTLGELWGNDAPRGRLGINPLLTACQKPTAQNPLITTAELTQYMADIGVHFAMWQPVLKRVPAADIGKLGTMQHDTHRLLEEIEKIGGRYARANPSIIIPVRAKDPELTARAQRMLNVTHPNFLTDEDIASFSRANSERAIGQIETLTGRLKRAG